jgi:hypothetical protein
VFTTRLQLGVVAWITLLSCDDAVLGVFKRLIRDTWKEVDSDNPIAIHVQTAGGKRIVAKAALAAAEDLMPDDILLSDPGILAGDDTSAWRMLRDRTPAPVRPPVCVPLLEAHVPEPVYCVIATTGPRMSMPSPPQYLDRVRGISYIGDRLARITGDRSTVGAVWGPHLRKLRGMTLVVGTGSGGIQAVLDGLNLRSDGLDLASIIPPGRTAALGWVPGDIAGRPNARLSSAMWDTTGNWFDDGGQRALSREDYQNIVLDIEGGGTRYGVEMLEPLSFSNWKGTVLMRVFFTPDEIDNFASWATARGFRPAIAACSGAPPEPGLSSPYIVRIYYAPGTTPVTYRPCHVTWKHPVYSLPADLYRAQQCAARDFSGGLEDRVDIPGLYTHCLARATPSSRIRGNTKQGQALMYTRLVSALSPFQDLYNMTWDDIVSVLAEPPKGRTIGSLTVLDTDKHLGYLHRKVLPRFIGSCLMWYHKHNLGLNLPGRLGVYFPGR